MEIELVNILFSLLQLCTWCHCSHIFPQILISNIFKSMLESSLIDISVEIRITQWMHNVAFWAQLLCLLARIYCVNGFTYCQSCYFFYRPWAFRKHFTALCVVCVQGKRPKIMSKTSPCSFFFSTFSALAFKATQWRILPNELALKKKLIPE